MPSQRANVLVICHVSAAEIAVTAARRRYSAAVEKTDSNGLIDVLCYGRASDDHPSPPGARLVGPSVHETGSRWDAVRTLVALRGGRYDVVALSQPSLGLSRARGLLLGYSYLVSGGRAVILDPLCSEFVRSIGLRLVIKDLLRWVGLQLIASGVAAGVTKPINRLAARPAEARRGSGLGSVAYLRTDIDLHMTPLKVGGSVAHTEGILRALLEREYNVGYWGTGEVDGVPASIPRLRLPALLKGNLPTEVAELASGIAQGLISSRRLRSAGLPRPSGFIYQRYSLNNLAGVILSRRWGAPLVLEANGSEAKWRQDFGAVQYPRLAYACERLILRRADVIAAVSTNAAEDLLTAGAPPERVRVVPNGVRVDRFAGATPMPLPAGFADALVVCFVGLFYPWHGVRFLAEAFSLLHTRFPDTRLLLVGDGEEMPVVKSVLQRHGVLEATHLAGLVPRVDAPRYMAAADVLVSPHADVEHFIGSPIKLFEYMASGKPIVATRVGQIEEVLTDEQNGLLVPPEEPEAMAAALERLYADPRLRERLGREAQRQATKDHSWDARLELILDGARVSLSRDC
jgi:glycosyltransferase involved in cell wall biosynthesis